MKWIDIKEKPLEQFIEVLAFNKAWVDEDKCPNGIRIGFLGEDGFISATWNMEHDCYDTVYEEGDDYYKGNAYVIEEEKKNALPNMPTHYMLIPQYNTDIGVVEWKDKQCSELIDLLLDSIDHAYLQTNGNYGDLALEVVDKVEYLKNLRYGRKKLL